MKKSKVLIAVLLGLVVLGGAGGWYYHQHTVRVTAVQQKKRAAAAEAKQISRKSAVLNRQVNQTNFSKVKDQNQQITKALNASHFVGTALVVKNDRVLYEKSFGYADQAAGKLNTPASKFQILSIQKSMTAVGIMQLVQKGKVKLSDPISKYYPQLVHGRQTTVRQMLDMATGLRLTQSSKTVLPEGQVVNFDLSHLEYYPDKDDQYTYVSVNFVLLAGIIRKVTGNSYRHFFEHNIIQALNLKHTGFVTDGMGTNATVGYQATKTQVEADYQKVMNETPTMMANEMGTGQVYMTVGDLYRVEKAVVDGQLISKKSADILHTRTATGEYGGGVYNINNGFRTHGVGYAYESDVHMSPDGRNAVVLMSNYYRPAASIEMVATKLFTELMKGNLK